MAHPTRKAASTTTGRHRRVARHNAPRRKRFTTVWPCAQEIPSPGTGVLADWLLNAVVKIVTTYSNPGDRVLLVAPGPAATPTPRRLGAYAGLFEAVWPIVRLGRGVQTELAAPYEMSDCHITPAADIELFNVIITAAEPRSVMAMRPSAWSSLLAPDGILAVLTHGQRTPARFHDPANALVQAAHRDRLRYLDRIAVLQVPIEQRDITTSTPPAVHARIHADLHIFSNSTTVAARPADVEDGRA